ncbi:MAG: hypothetical protein QOK21_3198 [Solirubrobacteraceae bacterium]|nr:hypothetical protein [Solirubrobacteraceae bacterium]
MPDRCPACSSEVAAGSRFCNHCGAALAVTCGACGAPAAAGSRFCNQCGQPLPAVTPAGAGAPPGAPAGQERRLVSVLFADLIGYTTFSEGRDPEEVRHVLSEYFEIARRIIGAYGGTVEKFIGDAVMALWGAPVAREDDAERAVRAALDLVAAITALAARTGIDELQLRTGILTGEAAVELDAVGQGMVVGDAVNTAARIQALAAPGTVLVDDVTRQATEQALAFEDAGTHLVKGRSQPVRVWRALRVLANVGGVGRSEAIEAPFVGRTAQLQAVKDALAAAMEPGARLRVMTVQGEAGLGKSRLAWELEKHSDGLAGTVLWHRGRCLSFGEGVGSWPIAEMVRMRARIAQDEPAGQQRERLDALLDDVFADDPDSRARADRALSRLLALDGASGPVDRGELFSSWRLLFDRLARRAPVVMVLEDVHWADQSVVDFILHLAEWSAASPLLIMAFGRPSEQMAQLARAGDGIELEPLSDVDVDALVSGAVVDAPAPLLNRVRAQADGVPLYAVETLRMLADRGVLAAAGSRYEVRADVSHLEVPPTIRALVASRLDALGPLERRVLLDGAVIGQRFEAAAVAALGAVAEADARALLDGLVAKQWLTVDRDPHSPERGRYGFLQAVAQRVAYETIARRERKARHLAVVEHLGGAHDPELVPILAGHLLAAAAAEPEAADAAEIRERALALVTEAAERSVGLGAIADGIALYERAVEMEPDACLRAGLLERAAAASDVLGEQTAAAARYGRAAELYRGEGDEREALRMAALELTVQDSLPLDEALERGRALYEAAGGRPDAAFAVAAATYCFILYRAGRSGESIVVADRAAAAAEHVGDLELLAEAVNRRSGALLAVGRVAEAVALGHFSLDLARRTGSSRTPVFAVNLAVALCAAGRYAEAAAAAESACRLAERAANRAVLAHGRTTLARVQAFEGRLEEAAATAAAAWAAGREHGNGAMVLSVSLYVALQRGDRETAAELIDEVDRLRQEPESGYYEPDIRMAVAVADAFVRSDPALAHRLIPDADALDFSEWPAWLVGAVDLLLEHPDDDAIAAARRRLAELPRSQLTPLVVVQDARLAERQAERAGDALAAARHRARAAQAAAAAGLGGAAGAASETPVRAAPNAA